jgi:hypothetical protein
MACLGDWVGASAALRARGEAGAGEVEGSDAAGVRAAMEALYDAAKCIDAVAPVRTPARTRTRTCTLPQIPQGGIPPHPPCVSTRSCALGRGDGPEPCVLPPRDVPGTVRVPARCCLGQMADVGGAGCQVGWVGCCVAM